MQGQGQCNICCFHPASHLPRGPSPQILAGISSSVVPNPSHCLYSCTCHLSFAPSYPRKRLSPPSLSTSLIQLQLCRFHICFHFPILTVTASVHSECLLPGFLKQPLTLPSCSAPATSGLPLVCSLNDLSEDLCNLLPMLLLTTLPHLPVVFKVQNPYFANKAFHLLLLRTLPCPCHPPA